MKNKLAFLLLFAAPALHAADTNPSILFGSPQGVGYGWIDLQYLQELHAKGFEVDYTDSLADIRWDRIKRYNVIFRYAMPDGFDVGLRNLPSAPEKITNFVALIERYLDAGGGVFLMLCWYPIIPPATPHTAGRLTWTRTGRWSRKAAPTGRA